MKRLVFTTIVIFLITGVTWGQARDVVTVTVTSTAGRSVFLDKGSADGLAPGLRVRFFPAGGATVEGVVRDVSTNSARAELPVAIPSLLVGTRGEVEVEMMEEQKPPEQEVEEAPTTPEHPPWTRQEGERVPDQPLLAPAFSRKPAERPLRIDGRIYTNFYYARDQAEDRDSEYLTARLGTWTTITNLFGHGGRLLFAGETDYRSADLSIDDDDDLDFRLDRLSYAVGGEEYAPWRLEFGRFYSTFVPELGLVDGVEGVLQFEGGLKAGAGTGAYLRPFPDRDWGDDVGFHVFLDYVAPEARWLSGTIGYQKTWHRGATDRDLFFGQVNLRPTRALWFYGSWKLDLYSSSDSIKGSGADLTEFWVQMRYAPVATAGVTASYSRYTWPELKRREYENLSLDLVQNGEVDRVNATGWLQVAEKVRLSAQGNYWEDQDGDGYGGEIGLNWRDAFSLLSSLETTVYYAEGAFTEGYGFRARAHKNIGEANGYIGYELFDYETRGLGAGEEDFVRQSVRAGLTWRVEHWSYSFNGDYYFGDREDAYSIGAYIEYNF